MWKKTEFDAITNHPNVVYLYPNALYAEVTFDEQENSITLVRGHGYPTPEITNGFDWKFDNTHPYEYDTECENWEFHSIDNGYMLNCYPEKRLSFDIELVKTILELWNCFSIIVILYFPSMKNQHLTQIRYKNSPFPSSLSKKSVKNQTGVLTYSGHL